MTSTANPNAYHTNECIIYMFCDFTKLAIILQGLIVWKFRCKDCVTVQLNIYLYIFCFPIQYPPSTNLLWNLSLSHTLYHYWK